MRPLLVILCVLAPAAAIRGAVLPAAPAQPPAAPAELAASIEAFLREVSDEAAAARLREILARGDAAGAAVLAAVAAPPAGPVPAEIRIPYRNQDLVATLGVPAGHGRDSKPLPVVLDISGGSVAGHLALEGAIVVAVPGFTPPQFSDEGRDAFIKILNAAAHAANGDPDRLWLAGFSWAAHACFDTAMHRPGTVRGIAPLGGGPRRAHFRLNPNLKTTRVLAFCGAKDDPELVWNLEEFARIGKRLRMDAEVRIDPDAGHSLPLAGQDGIASAILETPPGPGSLLLADGAILADAPFVASPEILVLSVDPKRTAVPDRVPVPARLDRDGQRRATLAAMEKQVARIRWRTSRTEDLCAIDITMEGIQEAAMILRAPLATPGSRVSVKMRRKILFDGEVRPDPRTILEQARRDGSRLRPALAAIDVRQ